MESRRERLGADGPVAARPRPLLLGALWPWVAKVPVVAGVVDPGRLAQLARGGALLHLVQAAAYRRKRLLAHGAVAARPRPLRFEGAGGGAHRRRHYYVRRCCCKT